jgi:hypothetical protein
MNKALIINKALTISKTFTITKALIMNKALTMKNNHNDYETENYLCLKAHFYSD